MDDEARMNSCSVGAAAQVEVAGGVQAGQPGAQDEGRHEVAAQNRADHVHIVAVTKMHNQSQKVPIESSAHALLDEPSIWISKATWQKRKHWTFGEQSL